MGCALSSLEKEATAAKIPPPPVNSTTAPTSQKSLAQQSLEDCLPPADDIRTGEGRATTKWNVFANNTDRNKFIHQVLLVLSDNGLRTISACRFDLFFPATAGKRLCRAILIVQFNDTVIQSFFSPRTADSHRLAFIWLMIEIDSQFETMLQKTVRNVIEPEPAVRSPPRPVRRATTRPSPLKKHASMPAIQRFSYPAAAMQAPNLLALPPSPSEWSREPMKTAAFSGLPTHRPVYAHAAGFTRPNRAPRDSRVSLPTRYHDPQHLRNSAMSHTSLHFPPPLAQTANFDAMSFTPATANIAQRRSLRHSGSMPVVSRASGTFTSTAALPPTPIPPPATLAHRRSRAMSLATHIDPAKREADREKARACLEGTSTTSATRPLIEKVIPSLETSSASARNSRQSSNLPSPTSLQYHHITEDPEAEEESAETNEELF